MKKMYKAMLLVLCAVLLVAGSVMGTLAYLKAQTGTVTNTFVTGRVEISLQEYVINQETGKKTNEITTAGVTDIKLVPGRVIEKNPFITVANSSEECYLFVKIANGLYSDAVINMATGWTQITGTDYWMYNTKVAANAKVDVFTSFTCSTAIVNGKTYADNSIAITAYAVQAEGFVDGNSNGTAADEAWAASGFGTTNSNP